MVATAVSGHLRLTVTTAVTGRLRLTVRSAVSGRPNPEVNKRHSNPDFEPIRHFRDLSAETMTPSMFRLWFMKLLFASGRIFHEKTIFYAQHDVVSWPVGPPLRSTEFGSVWGHFRVCEAEFPCWILFLYKLRTTSGSRGLLIAAVKMDLDRTTITSHSVGSLPRTSSTPTEILRNYLTVAVTVTVMTT